MSNPRAEVVVIGRARSGKSFLGNQLSSSENPNQPADFSDDESCMTSPSRAAEEQEIFHTSAGDESCTKRIKSHLFLNCTIKEQLKEKYDITYVDTPGFPDTRGAQKSIEVYNTIVEYINENEPQAIVWLLTPTREKRDRELYMTYALLMNEFADKGIYCAVLANYQGDHERKWKKIVETEEAIKKILNKYGLQQFSDDKPFISISSRTLKKMFLFIVDKAIKVSDNRGDVKPILTFEKMEEMYNKSFEASEAIQKFVDRKESAIREKRSKISYNHDEILKLKEHINDIENGATIASLVGIVFVALDFGATYGLVAGIGGAGKRIADTLRTKVKDMKDEINDLERDITRLQSDIEKQDIHKVVESHKNSMIELSKIYTAMQNEKKAEELLKKVEQM